MVEGQETAAIYGNLIEVFTALKRGFALHHPGGEGDRLTQLRAGALGLLSRMRTLPASECARLLRISRPQASALIDGLARAGLVERGESVADRRVVEVAITAEGLAALERTMVGVRHGLAERLALLSDAERAELGRSLSSLASILGKLMER